MDQIMKFFDKVKTDENLQSELKELAQRKAGRDEITALAANHGFTITSEEWESAAKEAAPAGELSNEQLASVSGGGVIDWMSASFLTLGFGCVISIAMSDECGLDD